MGIQSVIVLILILIILFVVFDTIKRVKGKFNRGWKVLFLAISLFFVVGFIELLDELRYIEGEFLAELLEVISVVIVLASVVIINRKVREVTDHHKKKKYRK